MQDNVTKGKNQNDTFRECSDLWVTTGENNDTFKGRITLRGRSKMTLLSKEE